MANDNDQSPAGADDAGLTADEALTAESVGAADIRAMSDEQLGKLFAYARDGRRYLDLARRTQAEFDNYQKRIERQRQDESRYAIGPFARDLLVTVDNLDRAIASAAKTPEFEPLYKGVGLTHQMLEQSLEKFGVRPICPVGQPFDPELHEAVMTGDDPGKPDGVVLDCFDRGWRLHERLLRPAKVRVNKKG